MSRLKLEISPFLKLAFEDLNAKFQFLNNKFIFFKFKV